MVTRPRAVLKGSGGGRMGGSTGDKVVVLIKSV